ncbi:MAG: putative RND superfamily exporter protein [Salibacteraceae bacterium]|jgi:predicted RND superfamily exporter protein
MLFLWGSNFIVKNYRKLAVWVLVGVGILSVLALYLAKDLRFDYEFEDYFPKSDQEYAYYNSFRDTFGSDNDFVLISLINEEGIFQSEFLEKVDSLSNVLKELDYIESVVSPTQLGYPVKTPFGFSEIKWLHWKDESRLPSDSLKIFKSKELVGNLISTDSKSITIALTTAKGLSKVKSDNSVDLINATLGKFTFDDVIVAGRIFGQNYYVKKMVSELFLFTAISFAIIIIFLGFAFRSVWGVIVPLGIVSISVVWLVSFMTLLGKSFDLMSTLLPTILFVVGMSDVIHFISRYLEELRVNVDKVSAIRTSFTYIGKATFLTSVTTAIGFLTLYTSGINPVRDFGLYTAIGVILAFILTFLILPPVLYLLPLPKRATINSETLFWDRIMRNIFALNIKHPRAILAVSVLILVVSFIGISKVDVNNFLLEDLSASDPMRANFEYFEEHYSGARPFEVVVSSQDSSEILSLQHVLALDSIESVMKSKFGIQGFMSLNAVVKNLQRANFGGAIEEYRLPRNEKEWEKIEVQLKKLRKQDKLIMILNASGNTTRISGKVKDFGGLVFSTKYKENEKLLAPLLDENGLNLRYTGMAFLIDRNNETLASSLMWGLILAFGAVAIIMGLIFKSVRMVLITFLPNVVPLLVVGGFMGWAGIDLKVSTSIIFTIAFGIAVDDTIHYVSKLKMELDKGRSMLYALKRASISTGKAIVLTSLILVSGFFALIFSDFTSTYYIGLLVSITLLFAVLADLFLLPVLIVLFYRKK